MTSDLKTKNFHVVVDDLDIVISIKKFDTEDFVSFYTNLLLYVKDKTADKTIDIAEYKTYLVLELVNHIEDESEEDFESALESLYDAVVSIYTVFSLENICLDLNNLGNIKNGAFVEEDIIRLYLSHKIIFPQEEKEEISNKGLHNLDDLNNLRAKIKEKVIGQDEAIEEVINALKLQTAGLSNTVSLFFIGPTGVGKSELCKVMAGEVTNNYYRINCAEYASHHEYAKLIGSPPGYIGHSEKSLLAEKAEISNNWVFLFDEVEKAHSKLFDFLLSLLDDGFCTDNMGRVLDFSNSIFVFTSNLGMKELEQKVGFLRKDEDHTKRASAVQQEVRKFFSPEFIGRIDSFVHFKSLTPDVVEKIAELRLRELPINITKPLIQFVVGNSYSTEYGARDIAKFIKKSVTLPIADAILQGLIPKAKSGYFDLRVTKGGIKVVRTEAT